MDISFFKNNPEFVFILLFLYIIIVFFYDKVKKNIKSRKFIEFLDIIRFLLVISPAIFIIFQTISIYDYKQQFSLNANNQHLFFTLIFFVIGNMVSYMSYVYITKFIIPTSFRSNSIFLIPFIHSMIYFIYLINQFTDYFDKQKNMFSMILHFIKNRAPIDHHNTSIYIVIYILVEVLISFIYVIIIYVNKTDNKIMDLICDQSDINKKCIENISQDVLTFTMFIKLILVLFYMVAIMIKTIF